MEPLVPTSPPLVASLLSKQRRLAAALCSTCSPRLPAELWLEILGYLSQSDFCRLARVCRLVLLFARPVIYTNLVLWAPRLKDAAKEDLLKDPEYAAIAATLALLCQNPGNLLGEVETLCLLMDREYYRIGSAEKRAVAKMSRRSASPPICGSLLRKMTALKALRIDGDVICCGTPKTTSEITDALQSLSLDYLCFYDTPPNRRWCPSGLRLQGLRELIWSPQAEIKEPCESFLQLVGYNAATLESLILSVDDIAQTGILSRTVFQLSLPRLRHLQVGNIECDSVVPPEFGLFLKRHSGTLQSLEIVPTVFSDRAVLIDETTLAGPGFLPRLERFWGHMKSIQIMAEAGVRSLRESLVDLTIETAPAISFLRAEEDIGAGLQAMFDALDRLYAKHTGSLTPNGRRSRLRSLSIDFRSLEMAPEDDMLEDSDHPRYAVGVILDSLRRAGRLWGDSVEVWRGGLPEFSVPLPASVVCEAFSPFRRLRILYFPMFNLESSESGRCAYFAAIASCIPSLEEIRLVGQHGDRVDVAKIIRTGSSIQFRHLRGVHDWSFLP